ncbi:MAG: DnaB-like helicase C-terminal domain-containing protein [Gemmatimonadaceae bacterium]|nr:DnaB-like helicase C-terminal domain-containing protein [Gemmatimonadaceae bacterium]
MSRPTDISPLARVMRRVDRAADGEPGHDTHPTGYPSIDKWLGGGVRRGDLVALGGDVQSGKSALALAIALRMAQHETPVVYFTSEMTHERVMERALAIEGRARVDDLRRGSLDDLTRAGVGAAAVRFREAIPAIAAFPPGGGVEALAAEIRRTPSLQVAIVDSLQGLAGSIRSQDEELAAAVRMLKALAIELNIAVVLTCQLPDLKADRADPRPVLDDFGVQGAVKQHTDVVLAIFREEMYRPGYGVEGATELLVRKNRNGQVGYVDLFFYKQWMRFEDMLDPDR